MAKVPSGYVVYIHRDFCKDVECPVQIELDKEEIESEKYNTICETCKRDCNFTAIGFQKWLASHGYLIVKTSK
ncbi:MAG: hypothetical protein ABIJ92_02290 [Candidatus Aenigmatarchaeota archaeon]